jgi:hypothetical protein
MGEDAAAMAARRGGGAKGSSATALTRGMSRPPGGPAGPGEMGRRRSASGPKALGHTRFE